MRKKRENKRSQSVKAVYTPEEFSRFKALVARSTCQSLCSYVRKVTLQEPVEIKYRNLSFDAFVQEIVRLKKELFIVRQLSLTPETEEQLVRLYEDIRTVIYKIADICMPS